MILDAIPGLSKLLDYFSRERHRREDKMELALSAIFAAASETKIYLAGLERTARRSRKKEEELSRLWSRAALAARRFDADLTDRCLMKSQYWVSPEKWGAEEVAEKRIGIDAVYEKARQLLLSR
jgi:hypothetical protein